MFEIICLKRESVKVKLEFILFVELKLLLVGSVEFIWRNKIDFCLLNKLKLESL